MAEKTGETEITRAEELPEGQAAVPDEQNQPAPGEDQAEEPVVAREGETGEQAAARAEKEAQGGEGAEEGEGEGAGEIAEDDTTRPAAITKADWDKLNKRLAEQHNYLSAVNDYLRGQAAEDAARAQQVEEQRRVAEEAKLPPEKQTSAQIARLEAQIQSLRVEQGRKERYEASRQLLRNTLDDIFEKEPFLEEWREEIEGRIPTTQGTDPQEIIREAARQVKQKVIKLKGATAKELVRPREELKGHRTLGTVGGSAPPAAARQSFKTRDDVVRYLAAAVPPWEEPGQRRPAGRK